jgi:hypothetical protein
VRLLPGLRQSLLHLLADLVEPARGPDLFDAPENLAFFVRHVLVQRVHDAADAHPPGGGARFELIRRGDQLLHHGHVGVVLEIPVAEWRARSHLVLQGQVHELVFERFVQLERRLKRLPGLVGLLRVIGSENDFETNFGLSVHAAK